MTELQQAQERIARAHIEFDATTREAAELRDEKIKIAEQAYQHHLATTRSHY